MSASSIERVQVALRIRPLLGREKPLLGTQKSLAVSDHQKQILVHHDKHYTFDHIYTPDAVQEDLYESSVRPLVDRCLNEAIDATVFAYGQTGSGKTFTMGNHNVPVDLKEMGLIPRAIHQVFASIKMMNQEIEETPQVVVRLSFLEIYREQIYDLLNEPHEINKAIALREDAHGKLVVTGLKEIVVDTVDAALLALQKGTASRTTGQTNVHDHSSRSHAIFTLTLHKTFTKQVRHVLQQQRQTIHIHLVDLAGSERLKRTKLNVDGVRFQESIKINAGLLALGNVIRALVQKQESASKTLPILSNQHVPYRQSKLTRFLQDSLGGHNLTLMIACISPAFADYEETLNTIWYASRARHIKNTPKSRRMSFHQIARPESEQEEHEMDEQEVIEDDPPADSTEAFVEDDSILTRHDTTLDMESGDAALIADIRALSKEEWLNKYIRTLKSRTIKALNATTTLQQTKQKNEQLQQAVHELECKLQEACDYIEHLVSYIAELKQPVQDQTLFSEREGLKEEAFQQTVHYMRALNEIEPFLTQSDQLQSKEAALLILEESFGEQAHVFFKELDKLVERSRGALPSLTKQHPEVSLEDTFEATISENKLQEDEEGLSHSRQSMFTSLVDEKQSDLGPPAPHSNSTLNLHPRNPVLPSGHLSETAASTVVNSDEEATEEEEEGDYLDQDKSFGSTASSLKRHLLKSKTELHQLQRSQIEQDAEMIRLSEALAICQKERDELLRDKEQAESQLSQDLQRLDMLAQENADLRQQLLVEKERIKIENEQDKLSIGTFKPLQGDLGAQGETTQSSKHDMNLETVWNKFKPLLPDSDALLCPSDLDQLVKTLTASIQAKYDTMKTDLEKDNYYYRQTNRELKLKLREFVTSHQKQIAALQKAQQKIEQLKHANKSEC